MKIECRLQRKGGTLITMKDGTKYHFKPDPKANNKHCAEVEDKDHISRFIDDIPEGYNEFGQDPKWKEPIPSDMENTEDDEFEPEAMDIKELRNWAKARGMNPMNKGSIQDYAKKNYGIALDLTKNPAGMIRDIANYEKYKK